MANKITNMGNIYNMGTYIIYVYIKHVVKNIMLIQM